MKRTRKKARTWTFRTCALMLDEGGLVVLARHRYQVAQCEHEGGKHAPIRVLITEVPEIQRPARRKARK